MKENQKGFSLIEVVLVLVIIGIIGAFGWYVYQSQRNTINTDNNSTQSTGTTSKVDSPKTTTSSATSTPSTQQYLDIKELGIKLPLSTNINDLNYSWDGTNANLTSNAYDNYIKQNDLNCLDGVSHANIGEINTSTTPPPDGSPTSVTVQNKTYYFTGPQQGCDPSDPGGNKVNDYTQRIEQAVTDAFNLAKPD